MQELINPELDIEEYRTAISDLMASYFTEDKGIELVEVANGYQFRTKMEHKELIQKLFSIAPVKLTSSMLEVLSITAYNQPITREKVEQIRGVDCSHHFRNLMDKKMIRMAGKSDDPGKPMLYATTKEFLELFGLRDLNSLPSLREIEEMLPANEVGVREKSEEERVSEEMADIVAASKPLEFNDLELDAELGSNEKEMATQANGNGSEARNSGQAHNAEIGGNLDQPSEAFGRLPMGPEGNA